MRPPNLTEEGYVFNASPYEPQGWPEIFAVVVISFAIFLVPLTTLLAVTACRARYNNHDPVNGEGTRLSSTVPMGKIARGGCAYLTSLLTRMVHAALSPLSFVLEDLARHGAEAASLLYVEREFARFFLFLSVFTNTILIPLHMTNRGLSESPTTTTTDANGSARRAGEMDFVQMTIQNLPENGGALALWIHVGFFYIITVFVLMQMRRLGRNLVVIEALARRARPEFSWGSSLLIRGPLTPSMPHMTQAELWEGLRLIFPTPGDVTYVSLFENAVNTSTWAKAGKWWNAIVTLRTPRMARRFRERYARMGKKTLLEMTRRGIELETSANGVTTTPSTSSSSSSSSSSTVEDVKDDIRRLTRLNVEGWEVDFAPDPQDVIWESFRINTRLYYLKTLGVNVLIGVVLIMFTTPFALISFVSGATTPQMRDELSDTYTSFVMRLRTISPWFADFLFNFIPQLVLVVLDAWLLFAFQLTSKSLEPHAAYTMREVTVFRKSFAFLLFNTLILPCFALSTVGAFVGSVLRNDSSPLEFFGRVFVANSGAFTLCFVATQTWVGAAMDISRLSERTVSWVRSRLAARPNPALAKFEMDYGSEHAVVLTVFSLCIVFATVAPPSSLFGVSYFLVKSAVDKYSLESVVAERELDQIPRAAVARSLVRGIFVPLLCFQMAVCGFFLSNVCRGGEADVTARMKGDVVMTTRDDEAVGSSSPFKPCIDTAGLKGIIQTRGSGLQLAVLFLGFIATCALMMVDLLAGRTKFGRSVMRRLGLASATVKPSSSLVISAFNNDAGEVKGGATEEDDEDDDDLEEEEEEEDVPDEGEIQKFVDGANAFSPRPTGSPRAMHFGSPSGVGNQPPKTPRQHSGGGSVMFSSGARRHSSSMGSSSMNSALASYSMGSGGLAMGRVRAVPRRLDDGDFPGDEETITPVIDEEEVMRLIGSR